VFAREQRSSLIDGAPRIARQGRLARRAATIKRLRHAKRIAPALRLHWHAACSDRRNPEFGPAAAGPSVYRCNRRRRYTMATLKIADLRTSLMLDRKAMSLIHGGGGAPWLFGWIQPYVPQAPSLLPVINLYQVNNTFYADQMINQIETVDVNNAAANSNVNVIVGENGANRLR
jgi:hypothetical protein